MNIAQRIKRTFVTGDRRWVTRAAERAAADNEPVTLDLALFTKATHFPDGYLRAGTVLGPVTASPGVYGPYDNAAVDGRGTAEGFLWADIPVGDATTGRFGAALLWHGEVDTTFLPTNHGLDAAARTDLAAKFRFRAS